MRERPSSRRRDASLVSARVGDAAIEQAPGGAYPDRYKWIVLSNTTLGMLMATIDSSIMSIALPDLFRGIHLDPLAPGNSFYLLWMILSFMIVTSVIVVSLGRLGYIYGRVKMYNLGFVVYTFFSLVLFWIRAFTAGSVATLSPASAVVG